MLCAVPVCLKFRPVDNGLLFICVWGIFASKVEKRGVISYTVGKEVGVRVMHQCTKNMHCYWLLGRTGTSSSARDGNLVNVQRTVLEHPSYNPDISTCDFHIFGLLKKTMKRRRFHSNSVRIRERSSAWKITWPVTALYIVNEFSMRG